jgi:flavin-dependent dehydrogenase
VAGCAASIALSRKGRSVTLIEREPTPRHKVCGEFLSGEALEDLHALGIDVASLGAVPIDYVRLAAARRAAEAPLPFPAASLTRKMLDTALIAEAIAAGVRVERGRSVQALSRPTSNSWRATSTTAPSGKLQRSFSPQASTISAATHVRRTRSDGSPSRCIFAWHPHRPPSWRAPLS